MSDLKPCPFCGETPVVQPWHGGGPNKISIGCENDEGCVVQPAVCDDDPEVARASWNSRNIEDSPAPTFDNIILDLKVATERLKMLRAKNRRAPRFSPEELRAMRRCFEVVKATSEYREDEEAAAVLRKMIEEGK